MKPTNHTFFALGFLLAALAPGGCWAQLYTDPPVKVARIGTIRFGEVGSDSVKLQVETVLVLSKKLMVSDIRLDSFTIDGVKADSITLPAGEEMPEKKDVTKKLEVRMALADARKLKDKLGRQVDVGGNFICTTFEKKMMLKDHSETINTPLKISGFVEMPEKSIFDKLFPPETTKKIEHLPLKDTWGAEARREYSTSIVVAESQCSLPAGLTLYLYRQGLRVLANEVVLPADIAHPCAAVGRGAAERFQIDLPRVDAQRTEARAWIALSPDSILVGPDNALPLRFKRSLAPSDGQSEPQWVVYEFGPGVSLPRYLGFRVAYAPAEESLHLRYDGLPEAVAKQLSSMLPLNVIGTPATGAGETVNFPGVPSTLLGSLIVNQNGVIGLVSGDGKGLAAEALMTKLASQSQTFPVIPVAAPPVGDFVKVRVVTTPPGAKVLVDGDPQMDRTTGGPLVTPADVLVKPGKHELLACMTGYHCATASVNLALEDSGKVWTVTLKK